jgi:hypothetical protein
VAFDEFNEIDFNEIDEELTRAFAGISAPPRLASSVRNQVMNHVRTPPPTRLPEVLDGIAWMGILSLAACVAFFVILK